MREDRASAYILDRPVLLVEDEGQFFLILDDSLTSSKQRRNVREVQLLPGSSNLRSSRRSKRTNGHAEGQSFIEAIKRQGRKGKQRHRDVFSIAVPKRLNYDHVSVRQAQPYRHNGYRKDEIYDTLYRVPAPHKVVLQPQSSDHRFHNLPMPGTYTYYPQFNRMSLHCENTTAEKFPETSKSNGNVVTKVYTAKTFNTKEREGKQENKGNTTKPSANDEGDSYFVPNIRSKLDEDKTASKSEKRPVESKMVQNKMSNKPTQSDVSVLEKKSRTGSTIKRKKSRPAEESVENTKSASKPDNSKTVVDDSPPELPPSVDEDSETINRFIRDLEEISKRPPLKVDARRGSTVSFLLNQSEVSSIAPSHTDEDETRRKNENVSGHQRTASADIRDTTEEFLLESGYEEPDDEPDPSPSQADEQATTKQRRQSILSSRNRRPSLKSILSGRKDSKARSGRASTVDSSVWDSEAMADRPRNVLADLFNPTMWQKLIRQEEEMDQLRHRTIFPCAINFKEEISNDVDVCLGLLPHVENENYVLRNFETGQYSGGVYNKNS